MSIYNDQVSYLGDSFAGRYVDGNGVTILVTKSAPAEKVTSFKNSYPKFTVREVTNSLQELQTIKNLIVSEMTSNPSRGIASVYTDIVHNKVVVDIINLDFSKETSFRQQVSNSPALEIRSVDSYDEATYTIVFSGVEIKNNAAGTGSSSSCAAATRLGAGGFLTHSHGRSLNDAVYATGTTESSPIPIGTVTALANSSGSDAAFITFSDAAASNYIPGANRLIAAYGSVEVGDSVTLYAKYGPKTGQVIALDRVYYLDNIRDSNGQLIPLSGISVNYYADLGDSGGCIVLTNDTQTLVGMQSSRSSVDDDSDPDTPDLQFSTFVSAPLFLNALNATLFN